MSWLLELAGFLGVAFYIGSYALLQLGLIGGRSLTYIFGNLIASSLVLVSLLGAFNLWSAIIQITWITISCVGLARLFLISRRLSFDEREARLRAAALPDIPPILFRRLLDAGEWTVAAPGDQLAQEGEDVGYLYALISGEVEILASGTVIARPKAPLLIGELTALHGGSATATVRVVQQAELFRITSQRLRVLAANDAEFRVHAEYAFGKSVREKLVTANDLQRATGALPDASAAAS